MQFSYLVLESQSMHYSDDEIIRGLKQDDQQMLKYLFDVYYEKLVFYSLTYVIRKEIAEEIIQELFVRIWENRKSLLITKSCKAYLFTSARNSSINYLRSKYARIPFISLSNIIEKPERSTVEDKLVESELKAMIQHSIDTLPPKCRIIFNLSRNSDLSNQEIANILGISTKTVDTQIRIAVIKMKRALAGKWD